MAAKKEKKAEKGDKSIKFFIYAIVILAIIILLILSIRFFYKPEKKSDSYSYNNFVFTNITGLWMTEIQKAGTNKSYIISLHYGPLELEDVPAEDAVGRFKNISQIYITFVPDREPLSFIALSASELSLNLARTLNITPIAACTINITDACANRPVVDCQNDGVPAIFLNYANTTQVYVKNNCIFVEGFEKEIVKATDRLLLKWFSVMD